jgi:hypothetical protein
VHARLKRKRPPDKAASIIIKGLVVCGDFNNDIAGSGAIVGTSRIQVHFTKQSIAAIDKSVCSSGHMFE